MTFKEYKRIEKKNLREALKDQNDMSLTRGARHNAHLLVTSMMMTTKKERKKIYDIFIWN